MLFRSDYLTSDTLPRAGGFDLSHCVSSFHHHLGAICQLMELLMKLIHAASFGRRRVQHSTLSLEPLELELEARVTCAGNTRLHCLGNAQCTSIVRGNVNCVGALQLRDFRRVTLIIVYTRLIGSDLRFPYPITTYQMLCFKIWSFFVSQNCKLKQKL